MDKAFKSHMDKPKILTMKSRIIQLLVKEYGFLEDFLPYDEKIICSRNVIESYLLHKKGKLYKS